MVVDVTDDGIADATYAASALIKVAASAETDADEDGIPDSSDTTEAANELPVNAATDDSTISADPGVKLVVGGVAFANGVASAAVDESTIAAGGEDGGDQPTNHRGPSASTFDS